MIKHSEIVNCMRCVMACIILFTWNSPIFRGICVQKEEFVYKRKMEKTSKSKAFCFSNNQKTVHCFKSLEKVFFFRKDVDDVVHARCLWLILPFYHDLFLFFLFLYLSFINCFCNRTSYTRVSFSIFVRDFSFSSFSLIF